MSKLNKPVKVGDLIRSYNVEDYPRRGWYEGVVTAVFTGRDGCSYIEFHANLRAVPTCDENGNLGEPRLESINEPVRSPNNGNQKWAGGVTNNIENLIEKHADEMLDDFNYVGSRHHY